MIPSPKQLSKKYRLPPRKRLGQSFLQDGNVVRRIVATAGLGAEDAVVEIGAGQGVMTSVIAAAAGRVVAVEIDPRLVEVLHAELADVKNLTVVHADVLGFDFAQAASDLGVGKIKVLGNIPYNISSPILFRLLEYRAVISTAVLMVQKEVAERVAAGPGTKDYGIPSVLMAVYAERATAFTIPPTCFFPAPKVTSAVLRLDFREEPLARIEDEALFTDLVRTAFGNRRKTLMNNLRHSPRLNLPEERLHAIFDEVGLDPRIRGEALSPEQFIVLANALAGR